MNENEQLQVVIPIVLGGGFIIIQYESQVRYIHLTLNMANVRM